MTDMNHAYLIVGSRTSPFSSAAIGVAFYPDPPDRKTFARMGFNSVHTTERLPVDATTVQDGASVPKEPTLFFFERGPNPTRTFVAKLNPDGGYDSDTVREEQLPPGSAIPKLRGSSADKFIPKPTGPTAVDVKKLGRSGPGQTNGSQTLRR
ncbi:MAG: hypothetical protein ABID61_00315 [Candidatus Micrarchaeota archaeon]